MSPREPAAWLSGAVLDNRRERALKVEWWVVACVLLVFLAWQHDQYSAFALSRLSVFAIAVCGMTFSVRYFDSVSLGHAAFMAVGAYASASWAMSVQAYSALGPLVGLLAGWFLAVILLPVLPKLGGVAYSMGTLAVGLLVQTLVRELSSVTGGAAGLLGIPAMMLGGWKFGYLLTLCTCLASLLFVLRGSRLLDISHIGRGMHLCGQRPAVGATCGFHPARERGKALLLSGSLCGLSGGLFALLQGYLGPSSFGFDTSIELAAGAVVAGTCSPLATVLAAAFFVLLPDWIAAAQGWHLALVGLALLLVQRFARGGLGRAIEPRVGRALSHIGMRLGHYEPDAVFPHIAPHLPIPEPAGRHNGQGLQLDSVGVEEEKGHVPILPPVSARLRAGIVYGLVGANGSGKTTLLNVLTGLQRHTSGKLTVLGWTSGEGGSCLKPEKAHALGVRRTFQTPHLVDELSALENVSLGIDAARNPGVFFTFVGRKAAPIQANIPPQVSSLFPGTLWQELAARLNTSQRRAVELLRALAWPGRALLLDEPASGLTGADAEVLISALASLVRENSVTVIAEHKKLVVQAVCDQILALQNGQLTIYAVRQ